MVELTLWINRSNPLIETYPQTHLELHELHLELHELHLELHPQVVRHFTCEKLFSFKLCLAFPVRI
jgi:hypothetical protein